MKSTISSKGRITIPAAIRRRLGLRAGTRIEFELRENGVLLRKGRRKRSAAAIGGPVHPNPVVADLIRRGLVSHVGTNGPQAYPLLGPVLRGKTAAQLLDEARSDSPLLLSAWRGVKQ